MIIKGLQKLTLLDYKGYLAATIFTGGCNFVCPFCHNRDLVLYPNVLPNISEDEVFHFLEQRLNTLDAVCITGGEPTLQNGLIDFIKKIKDMGYKIKLDTNGTAPTLIKELISQNLLDYIAMDIKNSKENYKKTIGRSDFSLSSIEESIDYIMEEHCDYEFRTTITKELHQESDIISICQRIKGAKAYYLQPYRESDEVIHPIFHSYSKEELQNFQKIAKNYVKKCEIVG